MLRDMRARAASYKTATQFFDPEASPSLPSLSLSPSLLPLLMYRVATIFFADDNGDFDTTVALLSAPYSPRCTSRFLFESRREAPPKDFFVLEVYIYFRARLGGRLYFVNNNRVYRSRCKHVFFIEHLFSLSAFLTRIPLSQHVAPSVRNKQCAFILSRYMWV